MILKIYSQNKRYSDISNNSSKPCTSNSSECRVKKLIQKYEDLSVTAENSISQSSRHCRSEQNIRKRYSDMLSDFQINLNKNNVYRFFSLDNHENKKKSEDKIKDENKEDYKVNMSKSKQSESERKYRQSVSPSSKKKKDDVFKFFMNFGDPDRDRKCDRSLNTTKKDNTYYKYDFDTYDSERKQEYSNSLPHSKKPNSNLHKKCSRSSSTTNPPNKFEYLSNNNHYNQDKIKTISTDGSSIVNTQIDSMTSSEIPNTGAIKKQMNPDDIVYRKRRKSYLKATQNDENSFRKHKIYSDNAPIKNKSYVSTTISKFEHKNDNEPKPLKKIIKDEISQLFQQYHDNKGFGKSNKMTIEELSLKIDNVLLNKYKQNDNETEVSVKFPVAGNHSNLLKSSPQNFQIEDLSTPVENTRIFTEISNNTQTDYSIVLQDPEMSTNGDGKSQGPTLSTQTSNVDAQSDWNVRDKLNEQLTRVFSQENLQDSVENLCNDIEKDLEVLNKNLSEIGEEIKDIIVLETEVVNMYEHNQILGCKKSENCANLEYIFVNQDQDGSVEEDGCKPKRKVSNLINFFSDKIAEVQDKNRQSVSSSREFNCDIKQNGDVFEEPKEQNIDNRDFKYSMEQMNTLDVTKNVPNLIFSLEETNKISSRLSDTSSNFGYCSENNTSLNSNASSLNLENKDDKTEPITKETNLVNNIIENNCRKTIEDRKESFRKVSNIPQEQIDLQNKVLDEIKPRLSRLYTGKFSRNYSISSVNQDTNNNDFKSGQTQTKVEDDCISNTNGKTENETLENTLHIPHIKIDNSQSSSEENIYDTIKGFDPFYSESEGEYDLLETYNHGNTKFVSLQRKESTSEWVRETIGNTDNIQKEKYDNFEHVESRDNTCMSDILRRSYSSDTLCTIYDECNNPAIRVSMMDVSNCELRQARTQEERIEESEKRLRRSIEEIQDNSKKACLINELITTEKKYICGSLHRLVHDYMPHMDKKDIPKGLIGKGRQIFGNADLIYEDHKHKFLPELEKYTCIEDIAMCFLNHETIFKLYPLYSKNKPKSDLALRDYGYYFKERQDELNDKLDLASYLLTPIQRLAKYCLLIKSLVKECEKENIECEKLKAALEMLTKQMKMGNDLIALDSIVNYNGSIRDKGEVLLRDTFMVQPPNKKPAYEGMIFLFQECLLITAIHRQGHQELFLYKESFQLSDIGYTNIESDPLEFSVWYRKRENNMYRFRTKSNEVKQKWVKEFFNLLWKQLEANKRRRKKELEENGIKDTRVPVMRPYSVPHKDKESTNSPSKSRRKRAVNSSADTIWYILS